MWKSSASATLLQSSTSTVSARYLYASSAIGLVDHSNTLDSRICKSIEPLSLFLISPLDVKKKTKVIDNNLDPEWNESFTFELSGPLNPSDQLLVDVFDFEKIGKNR